ncbi:hypothetical protein HIM_10664 [Hirsutella minnesotensis 3608]|uniref:Uncharacterized protein n=1 Tax=Hirsutella minnesotensis 3608 TaxID=1043627 RepID=A0A0F7ZFY3_9HYPO|nr:hypothetical protein HIM_10664 [Hirsutella minnesotensis 3608]
MKLLTNLLLLGVFAGPILAAAAPDPAEAVEAADQDVSAAENTANFLGEARNGEAARVGQRYMPPWTLFWQGPMPVQ